MSLPFAAALSWHLSPSPREFILLFFALSVVARIDTLPYPNLFQGLEIYRRQCFPRQHGPDFGVYPNVSLEAAKIISFLSVISSAIRTVTVIAGSVFKGCTQLASIDIPT